MAANEEVHVQLPEAAALRVALAARVEECWERLDDVVDELVSLHGVPTTEIILRVKEIAPAG